MASCQRINNHQLQQTASFVKTVESDLYTAASDNSSSSSAKEIEQPDGVSVNDFNHFVEVHTDAPTSAETTDHEI